MNEYDIEDAVRRFRSDTPNLQRAALVLARLMGWTNSCSDGWQYWRKPKQSARKLMALVEDATRNHWRGNEDGDITDAQLKAALTPIKAFLTRHGVNPADKAGIVG